jgi:hypothetical protein
MAPGRSRPPTTTQALDGRHDLDPEISPDRGGQANWLSAVASKGAVTQNDLIRIALHRQRKDLGAASRLKPETVIATAKASRYKLTPPRARGRAIWK